MSQDRSLHLTIALAVVIVAIAVLASSVVMALAMGDMWGMHGGRDTRGDTIVLSDASSYTIEISGYKFVPGNVSVPQGATVTWTNRDSAPHDATADSGDWATETLGKRDSGSITFENGGSYDYYCSIHPSMKARVIVR
jgi:plastocyanin